MNVKRIPRAGVVTFFMHVVPSFLQFIQNIIT